VGAAFELRAQIEPFAADAPRPKGEVALFWNTHSSRNVDVAEVDPRALPGELRGYFAR